MFSGFNYTTVPLCLGIKINGSRGFFLCKWTFRTSCFSLPMNDVEFIMFCCSIGLVPEIICVQVLCELLKMILLCGF